MTEIRAKSLHRGAVILDDLVGVEDSFDCFVGFQDGGQDFVGRAVSSASEGWGESTFVAIVASGTACDKVEFSFGGVTGGVLGELAKSRDVGVKLGQDFSIWFRMLLEDLTPFVFVGWRENSSVPSDAVDELVEETFFVGASEGVIGFFPATDFFRGEFFFRSAEALGESEVFFV